MNDFGDTLPTDQTQEFSREELRKIIGYIPEPVHPEAASASTDHALILVIRGMVERIPLAQGETLHITLGRQGVASEAVQPDFDLNQFGAAERGVSRLHARISVEDGQLFIMDLGSTNGTFVDGQRLKPHVPTALTKGDRLLLSRLPIQVMYR